MTLSRNPNDAAPVVLQEPERDLAPQWNEGFILRPEEAGVPGLNPGWAQVLAPKEVALWQGQAVPDKRAVGLKKLAQFLPFAFFGIFIALNIGVDPGLVIFALIAAFVFGWRHIRNSAQEAEPGRLYLLTNRAAYLARVQGTSLFDIRAFPITPTMQLGLGPHSVAFATRRNAKGEEEAEGFLDISDAAAVYAMIRDIQKGQL